MTLGLVCSDHEMMEFRIVREGNKANCRIITLDFRSSVSCLTNPLAFGSEMTGAAYVHSSLNTGCSSSARPALLSPITSSIYRLMIDKKLDR